jgi:hypothetical protein
MTTRQAIISHENGTTGNDDFVSYDIKRTSFSQDDMSEVIHSVFYPYLAAVVGVGIVANLLVIRGIICAKYSGMCKNN